ncbi:MAG: hypothetical protein LUQ31_08935 [Methanoregula sp.]|nr:hypothetical protein [Methanoregula sp.]
MTSTENSGNQETEAKCDVQGPLVSSAVHAGMTLEQVIEITGELSHLNELVTVHIEKTGGFSGPEAYFETVQPLLDLLEAEIRSGFQPGMSREELTRVVKNWIDREMEILS